MKISDIKVGSRARKSVGWLDGLERSIQEHGVLQPVGVTKSGDLIFGERRLEACKSLGMDEIPARIIDIDADDPIAALKMERDENNIRKDFTPEEKVEIARRIEEALAGRNGIRHDTEPARQKFAEVKGKSSDIAAEAVGWSGETYRQAKKVVDEAPPEVKDKVESGEMSVSAAYRSTRPTKPKPQAFRLTLKKEAQPDAESIIAEMGEEYATELAQQLIASCGHDLEVTQ